MADSGDDDDCGDNDNDNNKCNVSKNNVTFNKLI